MNEPQLPLLDLVAQYERIRPEVDAAIARVMKSGWFVLGREVEAFEQEFARFCGVSHAVGVGSGTEALHLILVALGATEGREVIAPAMTAIPTASAISAAGARPILADVEEATATIDPRLLERSITPRTAAVIAVHLYGQCADVASIGEICGRHGIPLVEDAAQAHGAAIGGRRAGGLGAAAAFSFYPSKNLGAFGDGGIVTTDDRALAERVRRLRNYGQQRRDHHVEVGFNSRLDEIQAAILRAKLPHLEDWNDRRRGLASRYQDRLRDPRIAWNEEAADRLHVRHLCVARLERRDRFRSFLASRAIQTQVHYPSPVHRQPAYAHLGYRPGAFPVAERLASEVVSIPLYPELEEADQDRVIEGIDAWLSTNG